MTIKKVGAAQNSSEKVKVAVRIRPFSQKECNSQNLVKIGGESTIFLAHPTGDKPPRPFTFDFCFGANPRENGANLDNSMDSVGSNISMEFGGNQEKVFRTIGMEMVENAFLGFNTCVFAYGQTGSGKSYTMMGNAEEPGLIPRLCTELFDRASREMDEANRIKVEISFYEIYNERIRDLLGRESGKRPLKVREHSLFGPMVEGLSSFVVNSLEQIEQLIAEGNGLRTTAATRMNEESSRSHGVFTIKLTQTISDVDDKTFTGEKISKISLVDLAGSERVQKTGATGKRLEEGGNINKSLTALGKVIAALASESTQPQNKGASFVPYRDSVLTWLLKENLGGNSRTTMIATVSPAFSNYEETLSTLRFADRAKRIQTHAIVNEDPNAKIIRELREEVDRLRLLNQSHAQQQEAFKMAMEQISERHQQEKKVALEQQYEQFSQYIRELTQNMPTPSSSSTPMTPSFGPPMPSISQSPSFQRGRDLNNNGAIGSSKNKFLEWAHRREELFTGQLRRLRQSIQLAHSLATEANSLIPLLMAAAHSFGHSSFRFPRLHFSVILQIPAHNLRPSKLALGDEEGEEEEEENGGGPRAGGCICEPVILAKWGDGRRDGEKGEHHLSVEQMECKLTELREAAFSRNGCPRDGHPLMHIFGNLLAKRERHSLIGVANVHLGALFHDFGPPIEAQVLIVNQLGEICGKLHVQVQRLAISNGAGGGSTETSDDSMDSMEELDLGENRPERFLGKTMICRVEIKKATNLPPEHCSFVFCQYCLHEQGEIVVPSRGEEGQKNDIVHFDAANKFELVCTRPFLEFVEEDALSIEIWGHRMAEKEEEEKKGMEPEEFDGEWEELEEWNSGANEWEKMQEVTERKRKSLRERWEEVTRRMEIWVEILELDERGEYSPVPILEGGQTGGIYKLRPGQQRRIQISLKANECGRLPFCMEEIESASIGSILVEMDEEGGGGGTTALDSYQELDLARLRAQWEELLEKRAKYLEREIHAIGGKNGDGGLEGEREKALLMSWVEMVEERNAISIPTAGIPGAPASIPAAGFEKHCPLIFLQNGPNRFGDEEEGAEEMEMPRGAENYLPFECDEGHMELGIGRREMGENELSAFCHWDSSLHGCPALNRQSAKGERIYLLLKIVLRIGQPFCLSLMLRKRICLQISAPTPFQQPFAPRWSFPWSSRRNSSPEMPPLTGTGLLVDLVACIPQSTLDMENRQMLAKLAVKDATEEEGGMGGTDWGQMGRSNYLSEFVSKTIQAVEWLIKMDRLRQEEAIGRALAKQRKAANGQMKANCPLGIGRMKRTISLPSTINNYLITPSSSFHAKFETIEDQSRESSLEGTPVRGQQRAQKGLPSLLHPSQSHSEGFKGHSPNSSGYASMAEWDAKMEGKGIRQRPNSLNLDGELKLRKMLQGTVEKMTSVVNPCALRLTGIEEEENGRVQQFPADDQQIEGPHCFQGKVATPPIDRQINAFSPSKSANSDYAAPTLPLRPCCCENRLFSPPPSAAHQKELPSAPPLLQQRKLFFQNTINSSSSSPGPSFDSSSIMLPQNNNKNQEWEEGAMMNGQCPANTVKRLGKQEWRRHFLPN